MAKVNPKKEEKAVAKKEPTDVAEVLDFLDEEGETGFEGTDADAYAIPFLKILQPTSEQLVEESEAYIEGAKPGAFFNNVSHRVFGRNVDVICLSYFRNFIEWRPNRGGFVANHGPDPSILKNVVEVDDSGKNILANGNVLQDFRNHYILLPEYLLDGPMILGLASSGIRHSKRWMNMMIQLCLPGREKRAPMFSAIWTLETILNKNDDGQWYQIGDKSVTKISFKRFITETEYAFVTKAREFISTTKLDINFEDATDSGSKGHTQVLDDDEEVPF